MRTPLTLTAGLAALALAACQPAAEQKTEADVAAEMGADAVATAPEAVGPMTPDATTPADPENPTGPTSPPRQPPPFLPPEPTSVTNPNMTAPVSPPPK